MSIWKYTYYPSVWTYLPLSFSSWSYDHSLLVAGMQDTYWFPLALCLHDSYCLFRPRSRAGNRNHGRVSLVVQWRRILLPPQGTWVGSLLQEDPTNRGEMKPAGYNHWACALKLQPLGPRAATSEARASRACAPQKRSHRSEKPVHHDGQPLLVPFHCN